MGLRASKANEGTAIANPRRMRSQATTLLFTVAAHPPGYESAVSRQRYQTKTM